MENNQESDLIQHCYILNKRAWFYPELHKLIYKSEGYKQVLSLNIPASRCLMLLIENRHSVVSRDDFLEYVWKSNGRFVALNTYYQNISILRKNLRTAGFSNDAVVTIAKKGLILHKNISVEQDKSGDIYDIINIKTGSEDNINLAVEDEKIDIGTDKVQEAVILSSNKSTSKKRTNKIACLIRLYSNGKIGVINFLLLIFFIFGAIVMRFISRI